MLGKKSTSCFLTLLISLFALTSIAKANLLGDYVASDNPRKVEQRRSIGSGSRSNCKSSLSSNSASLLIPDAKVVHKTTLSRPTFYLLSKASLSTPVKFTLVDPKSIKTIVEKDLWLSKGIKKITLPESISLEKGKIYLWYVAIPCEENTEQYYEVLSAAVEKVDLPKQVKTAIAQANGEEETASIYARNGIWYEALEYAVREQSSYLEQLLSSAGIY